MMLQALVRQKLLRQSAKSVLTVFKLCPHAIDLRKMKTFTSSTHLVPV